jgi:DNA invertase Pin-like site-specific DNA recombinase
MRKLLLILCTVSILAVMVAPSAVRASATGQAGAAGRRIDAIPIVRAADRSTRPDWFVQNRRGIRSHGCQRRRLRGAIYARFSTRFQASIKDQIRACRAWAAANDAVVEKHMIFFDKAVSGNKSRRKGLQKLKAVLTAGEVDVLIVFSTNRLHRNAYKARQFIEEEVVENGVRCVCIRSGVDTADAKRWKLLHGVNSIVDEAVLQSTAEHVREAHAGLLLAGKVHGTVTFGYGGEEIPGLKTRRELPQRRLVIDPTTSSWVKRIFEWYVNDGLSITKIAAKLQEAGAPLPPRCEKSWTELAVRHLLQNRRYLGSWSYGATKTVWLNKKDYGRQVLQDKPLQSKYFAELRIVDDVLFAKAQELLQARDRCRGRKRADGTSRPRILNGLLWCPEHDRPLVHGTGFYCPECRRSPRPALFSKLPADLAVRAVCAKLVELVKADQDLVQKIVDDFRGRAEKLQRPDLGLLPELERQQERLTKNIGVILRNPGETPEDEAESEAELKRLRADRAKIQRQIAELNELAMRTVIVPSHEEATREMASLLEALQSAAVGHDPKDTQALRQIIVDVTGGKIVCTQQGEARAKRGWLRGTFVAQLLRPFTKTAANESPGTTAAGAAEEFVEFKEPSTLEARSEEIKALFDRGLMLAEIAQRQGLHRNQVTVALQYWYERRGLTAPDGRARRSQLKKKHLMPPPYQAVAEQAMELYRRGKLLQAIASELGLDRNTITQAIRWWHASRGLDVPDGRTRRKSLEHKTTPPAAGDDGIKVPPNESAVPPAPMPAPPPASPAREDRDAA